MEESSPAQLLEQLDGILAESDVKWEEPSSSSDQSLSGELNDPDYTEQHKEYHKVTSHFEYNARLLINKACSMLEPMPTSKVFRLCSVGCGDGRMDKKILDGMTQEFPGRKIHYVGFDTNKLSCQRAKELLGSLKNVSVEVHNRDVQDVSAVSDTEPCDLVIGVNMMYYVPSPEAALSNAMKLTKPKGLLLLVVVSKDPYNELFHRFWYNENQRFVCFSGDVMKHLDDMGIQYTLEFTDGVIDLSQCFEDGFKHPNQKYILDFITQTKMERYPPVVAETCIRYLSSIAYGKPKETLIASRQDVIVIAT